MEHVYYIPSHLHNKVYELFGRFIHHPDDVVNFLYTILMEVVAIRTNYDDHFYDIYERLHWIMYLYLDEDERDLTDAVSLVREYLDEYQDNLLCELGDLIDRLDVGRIPPDIDNLVYKQPYLIYYD